jgi:AraC-like DNA-binding protein
LVTASSGNVLVTQNGRPIELQQSQMCLIDLSMPCSVDVNPKNLFTAVRLPRRDLLSICPRAESQLIECLGDNAALRETIARYSVLASAMAGRLDIGGQQLTAQHLVDLIGLLVGAGPHEKELAIERGLSAAQLNLIQAETLKHLSDDTLTVAVVARRCGVSPRHVQRLFERAGTTFTEFVLEHRLRLARRLLFSPGNGYGKIGSIAYDAGFSDISYFNRVFRKRFGATPSELRNSGTRSTGVENTAAGFGALESNTGGFGTTATGANALVR